MKTIEKSHLKEPLEEIIDPSESQPDGVVIYDQAFLLPLLNAMLARGPQLDLQKFIESNCASYVISCTSSKDPETRFVAFKMLAKFKYLAEVGLS